MRAPCDFLVSYTAEDLKWGEWIAWHLESAGHRVHLEAWDVVPGAHPVASLHEAVAGATRTVAVLTPAYLGSERVMAEWQAAWQVDPLGMRRTLIPVRVLDCEPDGLLRGIRDIDLVDVRPATEARRLLLDGVEASLRGRPSRPGAP